MKNLLRYIAVLMLMLGAAGLTACSSDSGDDTYYSISFATNPVMAGPGEQTYTVEVKAIQAWTAIAVNDWITGVTPSGEGDATISFSVKANESNAFRDGEIRFSVPGTKYSKSLTVRQMGHDGGLIITPNPIAFTTEGGEQEVVIYAMNGWKVDNVSDDWIQIKVKNNSSLIVTVDPNYTGDVLTGSVILKDGEDKESYTVPITQEFDAGLFNGASTPQGRRFAYTSQGLVNTVLSDTQYAISEHASVLEIAYMGAATGVMQPYRLFVFSVDLGYETSIAVTTADDDDASIKTTDAEETKVQIVREQLAAMQNKRQSALTVLGGVNGDFFYGGISVEKRNNLLHGIVYRRGVCLKSNFDGGLTAFALMKDGTAQCMTTAQYAQLDKDNIAEAIGGRQQLLEDGLTISSDATLEPRTAIGVSKDRRRVFIIVVDGRRDSYSIGASYAMMSKMFLALGASDAINLDGGGSSTFALRKESGTTVTADSFEVHNRPTDNAGDRAVVNGLAIVKTNE